MFLSIIHRIISIYTYRYTLWTSGVSRGWPNGQLPTNSKFIAHHFFRHDGNCPPIFLDDDNCPMPEDFITYVPSKTQVVGFECAVSWRDLITWSYQMIQKNQSTVFSIEPMVSMMTIQLYFFVKILVTIR